MLSSPSHAARMPNVSRWHHSARPTMNFSHHHHHEYPWPAPSALLHSVHAALAATALEPDESDKIAAKSTVRIATLNVLNCHLVGLVARPAEVLDAAARLRLLLDTFDALAASDTVVALQEVPLGWLSALRRHARKLGYRLVATFSKLARGVPGFMGVALAWPARAYDATAVDARQLHEAVGWPRQPSPPRDAAWTNVRGAVSAVVAARLRQRGGAGAAFVAASVHLPYDGRLGALLRPTQGVAAAIAARHVAALANRSGATLPHALAGDFNAPPGTTAHSVMLGQESPPQPARSVAWWPPAAPRRYRSAYAAAAGAEPPFTNVVASRGGGAPTLTLDYVWVSDEWRVAAADPLPPAAAAEALPNRTWPSDHLLLAVELALPPGRRRRRPRRTEQPTACASGRSSPAAGRSRAPRAARRRRRRRSRRRSRSCSGCAPPSPLTKRAAVGARRSRVLRRADT